MTRIGLLVLALASGLVLIAAGTRHVPKAVGRRPSPALRHEPAAAERADRPTVGRDIPEARVADAFDAASRTARARLDAAWRERDLRVLSLGPELPPEVWEARQREAQEAYERAKEEALRELLDFLSERPEYQPLRFRVEEWIDSLR